MKQDTDTTKALREMCEGCRHRATAYNGNAICIKPKQTAAAIMEQVVNVFMGDACKCYEPPTNRP